MSLDKVTIVLASNTLASELTAPNVTRKSTSWSPLTWYLGLAFTVLLISYGEIGRSLIFNPVRFGDIYDPLSTPLAIVKYAVTALVLAVPLLVTRFAKVVDRGGAIRFSAYLGLALISLSWSVDPLSSMKTIFYLFGFIMSVHIAIKYLGTESCLRIVFYILLFSIILSAVLSLSLPSIGQHSASDAVDAVHAGAWRGIFRHKNELGAYSSFLLVLALIFPNALKVSPFARTIGFLLAALCLIRSGSLTPAISAAFGICFYGAMFRAKALKRIEFVILKLILLLASTPVLFVISTWTIAAADRDLTLTGRTLIWSIVWDFVQQQPFGYGIGMGPQIAHDKLILRLGGSALDAHSGYLDQMLDLGVLGLLSFVVPALWVLLKMSASPRALTKRPILSVSAVIIAMCLFNGITETGPFRVNGIAGSLFFLAMVSIPSSTSAHK